MIPLKLTLKDFLCYQDDVPTLDLEGIHLACLCGQNGHGKSAMLDAITWALWGKARGRSQDELVHYGRDEMLVDMEFLARDSRYRVTRRHSISSGRKRQGPSDFQLQVDSPEGFVPITGNTIRETQAKVDQLIGMDYDTFINSAFLLQGRADEFTNKMPGERKEVLAKILGLAYYDLLQDRAKTAADGRRHRAIAIEESLGQMRAELSRREDYSTALESVIKDLQKAQTRQKTSEQLYRTLKEQVDGLKRKRIELDESEARIESIRKDISDLQVETAERKARVVGYQSLIDERPAIEEGLKQVREIQGQYETLNRSQEQFEALSKTRENLNGVVERAKARLEEQIFQLERRIELELGPKASNLQDIDTRLEKARIQLAELAGQERELETRRQKLQDLTVSVGQMEARVHQHASEGKELGAKQKMVQSSDHSATCPLCGTELGEDGSQRLVHSYTEQIEEKRELYRREHKALEDTRSQRQKLEQDLQTSEADHQEKRRESEAAVVLLERSMEESNRATAEQDQTNLGLQGMRQQLAEEAYAPEEIVGLRYIETEIDALGYDPAAQRTLYVRLQELQEFQQRHQRLEEATNAIPQETRSLERAKDMYNRRQQELEDSLAKQEKMEADVATLPQREKELRAAEADYKEAERAREGLFRRRIEIEKEIERLNALKSQVGGKEVELKNLRNEQGMYRDLAAAFGKQGVQALLIETLLPRIEEEANALLGRMTDNRMHLKLETQRERRSGKGEPIETLEIKISDEMGPRSYEMFSGGEAFRINLALRIALSKVLASRKGAPLPTLFIDEGFGTQDTAGREKILEVIRAIEDDFEKIIVITHLEDLKDAFPVRIEVQKEPTGSTFWIS